MRKVSLLTFLLFSVLITQAQLLRFGLKAGISSASLKVDELVNISSSQSYSIKTYNPGIGFQAGIFGRISVAKLYVQPEFLFSTSASEVKVNNIKDGTFAIRNQKFNKIDIPVLAGIKTGPLRLELGPVASFVLNSKYDLFQEDGFKSNFRKATIGYQAGVGFDLFKTLTLDVKYEGSISKLGNGITVSGVKYPYDTRTSQWIASLGIFF
jgi:hypothetical protein